MSYNYNDSPYANNAYPQSGQGGTFTPNPNPYAQATVLEHQKSVLNQAFLWMTGGLGLTALVALYVSQSLSLQNLVFGNGLVFFGLIIAELILVFVISGAINRLSPGTATLLFILYAAMNGLTLSFVFLAYTSVSIAAAFFITAGMFGVMSLYGYTTKRDLTGIGSLAIMALIGVILASIVNIFLASSALYWAITYLSVIIFVALTAYDVQRIKRWSLSVDPNDASTIQRFGILGALRLYLDFINLFLSILRITGSRN